MATYSYRARDLNGKRVKGTLAAESKKDVLQSLQEQKLYVTAIEEQAISNMMLFWRHPKIAGRDMAIFCRQFATMVNSGVPILTSLSILKQQTENKTLCQILENVSQALQGGSSLANAFQPHSNAIPQLVINMLAAGELGGVLDAVLEKLADHFEKEHDLNEKVKSALLYPLVLLWMAFLTVVLLLMFVFPTFQPLLLNLGVEMPLITKLIMKCSSLVSTYWYVLLLLLMSAILIIKRYLSTAQGKTLADSLLLKMPVFGTLTAKISISRFTRTLGTLLRGGVPILQALEVARNTAGNKIIAAAISKAQINIKEGGGMAAPLAAQGVFPPMVTQMILIGEETGTIDVMLEKISDFYDREVTGMVGRLSTLLEPLLILFLGVIIGTIVLSMFLPMWQIIGAF